jgi:enoyl-CoA hydratase/carnithine racemase
MTDHITVADAPNGVRLVTIARPEKKNALTGAMYDALRVALEEADASSSIRAVVFAGQPGMFSAGNDLTDFLAQSRGGFSETPALRFIRQLARTETPMVAAVDGIAVGIGATLTLHCDLVYASPVARLRMPFVELGLVPEAASSYLLPLRVGRLKATEILLLSEMLDADAAFALGLVNAVIPADMLVEHALSQAGRLAALPPGALAASRRLIRGDRERVEAALEEEAKAFDAQLQSRESQDRLNAFLSRSRPA